jgi:NosR/NirI family transcriptional regulator, nitrous oxide reductase regulator
MKAVSSRNLALERRARKQRRQRLISLAAFVILIVAWMFGYFYTGRDVASYVPDALPGADRIERSGELFIGYMTTQAGDEVVVGYAMAGTAAGYGGPLSMMVGTDPEGNIISVSVIEHRETPNFFRQLFNRTYIGQFDGKNYAASFTIGDDLDGVSGATLSAEAVAMSIRQAVRSIARQQIVGATIPSNTRPIKFGVPEITLITLFVVSFFLHQLRSHPNIKKYGRRVIMATGVLVLGFILNKPFTLANVISLLSGYWPDWHNNLYWFLLLGGILLVTSIQGKNPYCSWFCPFGATQEFLGSLTGAKPYQPRRIYGTLRWLQRGLAFMAIVLGLALRQPGAASYEPFGTLFGLKGSWSQWVLLILILFGSLVIFRPFCNYLCPLDPVVDYIGEVRRWVKSIWQKRKRSTSGSSS